MQKARKRATKQVSDSEISDDEFSISGLGFTDSEDDDFHMMSDEEESEDDDSGDESEDSRKMNYSDDDDDEEEEEYDFDGDGFVDDVEYEDDYDEEEEDVIDLETFASEDERLDDSTGLFMDDLEDDLDEDSDFLVDDDDGIDAIVQDVLMGKRQELRNMIVQGVPFGAPLTGEREQQTQRQKKQKQQQQQQLDVASTTTTTTTTKKSQTTKESDAKKKKKKNTRDAEKAYTLVIEPRTGSSPKKSYRQTTIGDTLSAAASREDIIPVSRMMGEPHNSAWPIFGLINTMGSVASRGAEFISLLCQLTAEVPQEAPAIQPEKTVQQQQQQREERKKRRRSSSDKSAAIQKHKRHRTLENYLKAK